MANSVNPDQTRSGSTLFVSILNKSVMLGNYLQQTTAFSDAFFLGAFRVKHVFLCINICWTLMVVLKPEPESECFNDPRGV